MGVEQRQRPNLSTSTDMRPPGLSREKAEKYLPERLEHQVDNLIDLFRGYNPLLPETLQRSEADFEFVKNFYEEFLRDRNKRSSDIKQAEYQRSVEKAKALIPTPTFMVLCMDGRVKPIHTNGFSADTAAAIRTPGGTLNEFIRIDGRLTLEENSNYAGLLLSSSQKSEHVTQVFDSHITCAARKREEAATGHSPVDSGLFRDVIYKKQAIEAAKKFLEKSGNGNSVHFIQTSFNPITGYLYMGLETEGAIAFAQNQAMDKLKDKDPIKAAKQAEYSKDVLKDLIEKGLIISTGDLIADPEIRNAFNREHFNIDRIHDYVDSAVMFWDKIEILWAELLPKLKEKLRGIYPELDSPELFAQKDIEERAMLLLTNAFNSYLHNKDHNEMEFLDMPNEEYEEQNNYEYGIHDEAGVKVSEGGYPPYEIPMFVIYSQDLENLSARIELSSQLVRGNRKEGRVKDFSGNFTDPDDFAQAPVPVVVQEIVRNKKHVKIQLSDWEHLEGVDWDDMPANWNLVADKEFSDYLLSKGIGSHILIDGIQSLRHKMARLYDPSQETASHLRDLYKTALPIVCDQNRTTHTIIPFVKVGRTVINNGKDK